MPQPARKPAPSLQAFRIEIRTPRGVEHRYMAARDVVDASTRATGELAIELPEGEIVAVEHVAEAL